VVGSLDDDFVGSDAIHLVVHAIALAVQFALDAQDGEFISDDANTPTRLIAAAAVAIGQDFGRSLALIAVVERTDARAGRRYGLTNEIAGTFGAIGGDDDPSPGDRILTQFRQGKKPPKVKRRL
jgi:hypothetical protein